MKTIAPRRKQLAANILAGLSLLVSTQTGSCFYNPSTGRWLSRDPIEEKGGKNLTASVCNDPVTGFDPKGLKKCGIKSFTVKWSDARVISDKKSEKKALTWHVRWDVKFRSDGEYDPRCCEFKQEVGWRLETTSSSPYVEPMHDDGYSRKDEDYSSEDYWDKDDPQLSIAAGHGVKLTWTATQTIYSPGTSWPKKDALPACACERNKNVAQRSHNLKVDGTFPDKLDYHDTIPATIDK